MYFALQYDEYKSPMDNIGMQDTLLSRFDIIFVVLDEMDPDNDRRISEHVLRMHRYRNPGEQVYAVPIVTGRVLYVLEEEELRYCYVSVPGWRGHADGVWERLPVHRWAWRGPGGRTE